MIVLLDNYDSFTYNLYQYVEELGLSCTVIRNDAITPQGILHLRPSHLILSPGPGNPDEAGITLAAIAELSGKLPILGVCLGHQAIGQSFGGRVIRAKRPMHGKLSKVRHDDSVLFQGVANPFAATRYHSLVVERAGFPETLAIDAETADGLVMGLRHQSLPIFGVQFHPESIASEGGHALLANFLAACGLTPKRIAA